MSLPKFFIASILFIISQFALAEDTAFWGTEVETEGEAIPPISMPEDMVPSGTEVESEYDLFPSTTLVLSGTEVETEGEAIPPISMPEDMVPSGTEVESEYDLFPSTTLVLSGTEVETEGDPDPMPPIALPNPPVGNPASDLGPLSFIFDSFPWMPVQYVAYDTKKFMFDDPEIGCTSNVITYSRSGRIERYESEELISHIKFDWTGYRYRNQVPERVDLAKVKAALETEGMQIVNLTPLPQSNLAIVALSPDFIGNAKYYLVDANTGNTILKEALDKRLLRESQSLSLKHWAMSANGRYLPIAVMEEGIEPNVSVVDLQARKVFDLDQSIENVYWISDDGEYYLARRKRSASRVFFSRTKGVLFPRDKDEIIRDNFFLPGASGKSIGVVVLNVKTREKRYVTLSIPEFVEKSSFPIPESPFVFIPKFPLLNGRVWVFQETFQPTLGVSNNILLDANSGVSLNEDIGPGGALQSFCANSRTLFFQSTKWEREFIEDSGAFVDAEELLTHLTPPGYSSHSELYQSFLSKESEIFIRGFLEARKRGLQSKDFGNIERISDEAKKFIANLSAAFDSDDYEQREAASLQMHDILRTLLDDDYTKFVKPVLSKLTEHEDEEVVERARRLLEHWNEIGNVDLKTLEKRFTDLAEAIRLRDLPMPKIGNF